MSARLNEEQKRFISTLFLEEKLSGKQIIEKFQEKYDRVPSASVINRWQYYNKNNPLEDKTDDEEITDDKTDEQDGIKITKKDTRKQPEVYNFSDGEISEEVFDKIVELTGKSKKETWELMKKAMAKGYITIDLKTGELSK